MDLSIVIINFNTKRLTEDCVASILRTAAHISFEIVVVDNSTRAEERYVPPEGESRVSAIVIENKGFGNGCNAGMAVSRGRYLLMLNSDTIVGERTLDESMVYMDEHADIGVLGVKILLRDGTLDHGCKRGFPTPMASLYYMLGFDKRHPGNPKYGRYRLTYLPEDAINEVDVVSGAYMLLRRTVYEQTGGFDEVFFMYGEDVDLCYRIKQLGWKIVYYPPVSVLHLRGQSGLQAQNPFVLRQFYNSMLIFYDKHYRSVYNPFVTALVHLAVHAQKWIALIKAHGRAGRRPS